MSQPEVPLEVDSPAVERQEHFTHPIREQDEDMEEIPEEPEREELVAKMKEAHRAPNPTREEWASLCELWPEL